MGELLVGYDGSETAKVALYEALALAQPEDPITVLNAYYVPSPLYPAALDEEIDQQVHADSDRLLDEIGAEAEATGRKIEFLSRRGLPAETLASIANERQPELVVVGSRGLGPVLAALGSETIRLLHHSHVPVLVVPKNPAEGRSRDVLIGFDGSPESERAVVLGTRIATSAGGRVVVLNAYRLPGVAFATAFASEAETYLRDASEELLARASQIAEHEGRGAEVQMIAQSGPPVQALNTVAEDLKPRMFAIGSRGHGAIRSALGSQTLRLLHTTRRPVLIVPPQGD